VIEYQYCDLPHAHMVLRLGTPHDIDANNCKDLFDFVNRNFVAEMPRFEGDGNQNVHWWDNQNTLTTEYKEKAIQMV
jgi:hypothetical protein